MNARTKSLAFSGAGAALVLGLLAALNAVAAFVYARLDLSAGREYSISAGTKKVLSGLEDTLLVRVYFTPRLPPPYGLNERYLRDLLDEYREAGRGRVRVEYVDPSDDRRQLEARAAGVIPVQVNVTSRDKFEAKEAYMGAALLYRGKSAALPVVQNTADLEYDLTRRILALTRARRRKIGFLSGHGERAPGDDALAPFFGLLSEQLDVETVSIATAPVPSDLDALWILAPVRGFRPAELQRLTAFAKTGKSIGLLLNRRSVSYASFGAVAIDQGLGGWLKDEWGLEERPGFVVDAQAEKIQLETEVGAFVAMRVVEYPYIPIVTRFNKDNPAVKRLPAVSFPFVHPIAAARGAAASYASLADTSDDSWYNEAAEVGPTRPIDKLRTKERGPFSVAGVATRPGEGRLIVVGTGYLVDPRSAGKAGAYAFLANLIDWSFQDDALLSIRAKGMTFRPLRALGDSARTAARLALVGTLPLAVALAGLLAYRRQRARRAETAARYADA